MASVGMTLSGFASKRAAFKAMPKEMQDEAIRNVRLSTMGVAQRAQILVPVRTGFLKSRISWSVRGLYGRVGFPDKDTFYWWMIEKGTIKKKARPFMRPAGDAEEPIFIARMRASVRNLATSRFN